MVAENFKLLYNTLKQPEAKFPQPTLFTPVLFYHPALFPPQSFMETEHTKKEICTIGHSTRSEEDFMQLLKCFEIELVVDIRTFPGSKRYPHFNKELLSRSLKANNIRYLHLVDLGGRRKPLPDSPHTAWRHASFRGYADHMETPAFKQAIQLLENEALQRRSAYMCSEAMWWKCHRAMVSDYLKVKRWSVYHILAMNKSHEHPYTSPARPEQGELFY